MPVHSIQTLHATACPQHNLHALTLNTNPPHKLHAPPLPSPSSFTTTQALLGWPPPMLARTVCLTCWSWRTASMTNRCAVRGLLILERCLHDQLGAIRSLLVMGSWLWGQPGAIRSLLVMGSWLWGWQAQAPQVACNVCSPWRSTSQWRAQQSSLSATVESMAQKMLHRAVPLKKGAGADLWQAPQEPLKQARQRRSSHPKHRLQHIVCTWQGNPALQAAHAGPPHSASKHVHFAHSICTLRARCTSVGPNCERALPLTRLTRCMRRSPASTTSKALSATVSTQTPRPTHT